MLYRVLSDTITAWVRPVDDYDERQRPSGTRLRGGFSAGGPCKTLKGLPMPRVRNGRVRFWFTERGWRDFGQAYAAELSGAGHIVRVMRIKDPPKSRIAYRDQYQVALLPPRPGE